MKKLFILLLTALLVNITFGQAQEKIYYNSDWKVCNESKAEYYRLISFDENGKPIGKVKDYYISGELQWEGYFSYVDKFDNSKDINEGLSIWYYKNGQKSRESTYVNGKEEGLTTFWYESGKLKRSIEYKNGKIVNNGYIDCDEFGKCQNVFYENFGNKEIVNDWKLNKGENYNSYIIEGEGLLFENTSEDYIYKKTINIPLNLNKDFSIETTINFKSGNQKNSHGLIWGVKDWDNYYYFFISANGYYRIGGETEGLKLEFTKWKYTSAINQTFNRNNIKILRVKDKLLFAINGTLVHSEDFYAFHGNNIGFATSGKKSVLFENLIVKQDIENNLVADNIPSSVYGDWKGNGTGFFISKDGYLATNYHVVAEATEIEIEFIRNGQKQNYKAKVIQSDKQNDLAVLKIDDNSFVPFSSIPYNFQTSLTDVGSNVFALGYPMALSVMGTEIKFTDGKISSKTGFQGDIATYQMTTPIQPGNSGGPLFDFDGNLIGINSAKIRADVADNVSYAIKSIYLKNLIDVLPITLCLPNDSTIKNKALTEKIKIISDYVVLIRIK